MSDDPNLKVKVTADTKEAEGAIEKFGGKVAGAFAAYFSAKAIASGIQAVVAEATEGEQAVHSFNLALQAAGKFTDAASSSFQNFAANLEMTTGVQDDVILKNSAMLVSIGKLSGQGLNQATTAALDLARGMNVDVGTAFNVMAKAAQGNTMALAKYGLEVRKGATDSEKFAAALAFVENRFGGMAAGNLKTWEGVMTKLTNGFDKFKEAIGNLIIQSPKLKALFSILADGFYSMAGSLERVGKSGQFMDGLVDKMFAIGHAIINWILKPLEAVGNIFAVGLMTIITSFISTLGTLASAFDKLFGTNHAASLQQMAQTWAIATEDMAMKASEFDTSSSQVLQNGLTKVKEKVDATASSFRENLIPAMTETAVQGSSFWSEFTAGFQQGYETIDAAMQSMSAGIKALGAQTKNTFVNGFSNAFASVGKNLVEGRGAFSDFGKVILGMLGNVAMQMGSFFIAAGIGFLFLDPGRGAGLIAAGIGLSLLGGILQALGGSGTGTAAAATESSGAAPVTNVGGSGMALADESERQAPGNNFTFVVEGNIFDTQETGKRIVDIMHTTFADTGATLPKGIVPT